MKKLLLFGGLLLSSISFAQLNVGLIAQYDFSGDALDASGNNYHGTINGSPTLVNDRNGNPLSAYNFDGIDDYIMVDGFQTNHTNYSLCAWINNADSTQLDKSIAMQVAVHPTTGDSIVSFGFATNGATGGLNARHRDNTGMNISPNNGVAMIEDWRFAVQTYDGNTLILYLDGVNVASAVVNSSAIKADQFMIGAGRSQAQIGAYFFNGIIDDIRVYNRELTLCEIQDLYLSGTMNDVTQNGTLLTADQSGATYQWLDCDDNNSIINGETNQTYTPALTGNYAVEVTFNGCVDTSACMLVDYTGIDELNLGNKELIKVVDLMGRETTPQKNMVLIYVYSDGTTERIFEFE